MDLTILSDEELDFHYMEILSEKERRANLKLIPEQIALWATKYESEGGNRSDLQISIDGTSQPS